MVGSPFLGMVGQGLFGKGGQAFSAGPCFMCVSGFNISLTVQHTLGLRHGLVLTGRAALVKRGNGNCRHPVRKTAGILDIVCFVVADYNISYLWAEWHGLDKGRLGVLEGLGKGLPEMIGTYPRPC